MPLDPTGSAGRPGQERWSRRSTYADNSAESGCPAPRGRRGPAAGAAVSGGRSMRAPGNLGRALAVLLTAGGLAAAGCVHTGQAPLVVNPHARPPVGVPPPGA